MSTTNETEGADAPEVDAPAASSPPPRRRAPRRAASRPAGPPVGAAPVEPPPVAEPVDPLPVAEPVEAIEPPSHRAEPEPEVSAEPEAQPEPEPEVAAESQVAAEPEVQPEPEARARRRRVVSPVFQAPDMTSPPRRHRAASRPAGPPQPPLPEPLSAVSTPEPGPAAADELVEPPVVEPEAPAVPGDDSAELADDAGDADTSDEDARDDLADDASDDVDDSDDEPSDDEPSDDEPSDDEQGRGRRPRRRRGGRGRRRRTAEDGADDSSGAPDDESADARPSSPAAEPATAVEGGEVEDVDPTGPDDDDAADSDEASDPGEAADEADGSGTSRRRRRRRRGRSSGESAEVAEVTSAEAPVARRSRARRTAEVTDDVTAVRGSTRLEAKRQRRRDGRDGGRRRTAITEAEFLARRESVERTMVVRSAVDRAEVAVLEDGVLVEHYVARKQHTSMIGNVHLGRVQNVLPSMEAAFVDIGRGRNAVLYAGEVDWDAAGLVGSAKKIEAALKPGDTVLVQVTKDPIGHKGSRLTSQISLPGRYLVYVPNGSMTGISRKLPDTERTRLKSILKAVVPEAAGVIVRTAAEGASETELRRDVERLAAQWEEISARATQVKAPSLLHGEPDLVVKVVRDVFNEDFTRLVVDGEEAWTTVKGYVDSVAPDLSERVSAWADGGADGARGGDAFAALRIDEQIAKALERKVWLPSGGSLVIDRTEAMTVVDVNTGRFTGAGGNLEETVTRNNLEAAEEIVRQLRLRDIGGIIVVDFIDMVLESNRELVLRRLVECLGRDRTKHQVAEVTSLGLVQMTRKRVGQGLIEAFSEPCEHCAGRGVVVRSELLGQSGQTSQSSPSGQSGQGGPVTPVADAVPDRPREVVARDAVREAIREVAQASRLHASPPVEQHADEPEQAAAERSPLDERAEAARAVAALVGEALAAHTAELAAGSASDD